MILVPAKTSEDWKGFLAEPDKHWKDGFSAKSLADKWQNSYGLPSKVQNLLMSSQDNHFEGLKMLFGIPEFKVMLPGGGRASQNDLFVLARTNKDLVTIMVEGKVSESFGPLVYEWKINSSEGKKQRLKFLCNLLSLDEGKVNNIRYQLLHRTASAILTAQRFHCKTGVVLVHSFSKENKSFDDYHSFLELYNFNAQIDKVTEPFDIQGITLYWAWVRDEIPG